jgi:hypothetical protein
MTELSNGMTLYHRTFVPFLFASVSIVGLIVSHGQIGLALPGIVLFGYTFWFGRRLSDVWLDGDVLEVKGPTASFRVPLSDVRLLGTRWGHAHLCVLGWTTQSARSRKSGSFQRAAGWRLVPTRRMLSKKTSRRASTPHEPRERPEFRKVQSISGEVQDFARGARLPCRDEKASSRGDRGRWPDRRND